MASNAHQHGAIDVIGGICGAAVLIKLRGLASERLPAAMRFLAESGGTRFRHSAYTSLCSMLPPWNALISWCDAHSTAVWPIMLAIHAVCSSTLTGVLYALPEQVQRWFFAGRGTKV